MLNLKVSYLSRFREIGQLVTKVGTGNRKFLKKINCFQIPPAHFVSHPPFESCGPIAISSVWRSWKFYQATSTWPLNWGGGHEGVAYCFSLSLFLPSPINNDSTTIPVYHIGSSKLLQSYLETIHDWFIKRLQGGCPHFGFISPPSDDLPTCQCQYCR